MSLTLPPKNDFEITPSGTHVATCYRVIDLGTQMVEYKGVASKKHQIMISWELPNELMEKGECTGKPFSIHKKYTLSSSDKATLRRDLQAWRGKPFSDEDFGKFDIGVLIGKGCLIGIVHTTKNDTTYANISSIMKLPKGQEASALINPSAYFSLNEFNQEVYDKLSDNLKATIAKSPEYQELKGANTVDPTVADGTHEEFDDQTIPF